MTNLPNHLPFRPGLGTRPGPDTASSQDTGSRQGAWPNSHSGPGRGSRLGAGLATLGIAALLAGCGSSGGSSTITVGNESAGAGSLVEKSTTVTTPTSGPLSKEPTITASKGPAPTELKTKEIVPGTGAEAKAGDSVTVNYVGALYKNGKVFDASWKRHEPFTFTLGQGQVIPGWDKGVAGMKVGGRRELIIPAALAYGKAGRPPTIPPNSPLVFIVDLLGA
jgi:peptidylprolyl isomerase